ncbi:MAG: hypothetical protein EAZ91_18455 [Cytophagales bacterium]|nr:MAG: hypothetical protein EAZ91_18455 [Cytophagales bacterium]
MKVLLDENLPNRLKFRLLERVHEVFTAREMGWNGQKNGNLLGLLTANGFEVLITSDKNLVHQQNLNKYTVNVLLLRIKANRYPYIQALLPQILYLLESKQSEQFIAIDPV